MDAIAILPMPRGRLLRAYAEEARCEILRYLRNPGFLLPIRDRLAAWAKVEPRDFAMALINDYRLKSNCGRVPLT